MNKSIILAAIGFACAIFVPAAAAAKSIGSAASKCRLLHLEDAAAAAASCSLVCLYHWPKLVQLLQ